MPYFQERPMRHIFLVEVSSWSEHQNSLKEKLTEKRHLAMLEIYGIVSSMDQMGPMKGIKTRTATNLAAWHYTVHGLNMIEHQRSRCETMWNVLTRYENSTPLGLSFFLAVLATLRLKKNGLWHWLPSIPVKWNTRIRFVLHWEPPSAAEPASSTRVFPWRTLCLVHGDWPSNWRSRPLEDVGWGQGLLLNSWHLSQSPTVSHFKIFRSNQHLVKWSDAEINYGKSHQLLKIKAISS